MPRTSSPGWVALALCGGAAAALHLVGEAHAWTWVALVAKPIPVLLLAAAVLTGTRSALRATVGAGLLVSAAGDVVIQLPGGFLGGLALFLLAHVIYAAGFWRAEPRLQIVRALPVVFFGAFMASRLHGGLAAAGAAFQTAVALYIVAICTMLWRAAALVGARGLPREVGRFALGGAMLFAASDSLIAIHRFVAPLPWADVPIMLLYWLGQAGIALAALSALSFAMAQSEPQRPSGAAIGRQRG